MSTGTGIKRLLLGIEVTIFGGILVLAGSGSAAALGLLVAVVGLIIAVSGMGAEPRD